MAKLYFITYDFSVKPFYSLKLEKSDVEKRIETFRGFERDSWVKRYEQVKTQCESGFHHNHLKSGFIKDLTDFNISETDMYAVINGI